ncbi:MAG: hypothetical protein V1644_03410 [Candidatus Micrarchaeota archaeon]
MGVKQSVRIGRARAQEIRRQSMGPRNWPNFHNTRTANRPGYRTDCITRAAHHPEAPERINEFASVLTERKFEERTHRAACNALLHIHKQHAHSDAKRVLRITLTKLKRRTKLPRAQQTLIEEMRKTLRQQN